MVKFNLSNKTSKRSNVLNANWTFLVLLILSLIIILVVNNQGKVIDDLRTQDYLRLQEANKYIENQELSLALPILKELNAKYSNEFMINYKLGNLYLQMNQVDSALPLYNKTLDLNPHLVENVEFMYQYASLYLMKEDIKNVARALKRLEQLPLKEEYIQYVQGMREQILIMEGNE